MNNRLKVIIIPSALVAVFVTAVILGWILISRVRAEKCNPLTPLALEKFKIAGGKKPIEGEKCGISKKSYLLILSYEDSSEAIGAKQGLEFATSGERDKIDGLDWITDKGASAIFWTSSQKLAILVAPDEDSKKAVKKELDRAFKRLE